MPGDTAIATVCLSGTLEDKLAAAAAAGFDGVEIFENDLIASRRSPSEIRQLCADLGLTIDLYQPFRDFEAVPPEVFRANLRRADRKFDLMAELGADTVLVCSSVSPDAVDDDDLAALQLRELASLAASRGIRVAYEALAWARFVNTYEHAWRLVRRADHPALGVCLDSFHILSRRGDPRAIRTIPGEKIFFLQLADAPLLDMDVLHWSRHHRLFPGQGAFDLTAFTGHVLAAGYRGPLSLEVFNDVFRQADPRPAAVDAMRSLLALRESLGGLEIPAPAELSGHAFAEVSVTEESETGAVLETLGFVRAGTHRSKPVQLWQQGSARVLVNETGEGGAIRALGLTSADPAGSVRRAETLLAPVLPREHGPDEADLAAVAAPDGTEIFFCGSDEWLRDFASSGVPSTGLGITGIDHIALAQPFDHFDEATLFYRSVLGLPPEPVSEFAAPFGLVRSRSVGKQDVRLTLDSALVRRGEWAPGVPSPQHIAFACEDVFAAARAMRDTGAPLLSIPGNYYDDLDARFDLPYSAALREYSVLYDRDDDGEFLHFCTVLVGSRVFFEVVQRIGGYRGYGVVNTPVYMAAHRERRLENEPVTGRRERSPATSGRPRRPPSDRSRPGTCAG